MKESDFESVKTDSSTQEKFFCAFSDSRKSPGKILLRIYKGNYVVLLKAVLFYLLKTSPTLILPIVTANIINIATYPQADGLKKLTVNGIVMAVMILQNIVTHYLYTKYHSLANRRVELNLRSSMIRKLQQLSITFHK